MVGDVLSVRYLRRRRATVSPCSSCGTAWSLALPFLMKLGSGGWEGIRLGEAGKGSELEGSFSGWTQD